MMTLVVIVNIALAAFVLIVILGMLVWAILSSGNDETRPVKATRRRLMPRPSFPHRPVISRGSAPRGEDRASAGV